MRSRQSAEETDADVTRGRDGVHWPQEGGARLGEFSAITRAITGGRRAAAANWFMTLILMEAPSSTHRLGMLADGHINRKEGAS
jgi:hypothetical protein